VRHRAQPHCGHVNSLNPLMGRLALSVIRTSGRGGISSARTANKCSLFVLKAVERVGPGNLRFWSRQSEKPTVADLALPFASFVDTGVSMSFGSDARHSLFDPWLGIAAVLEPTSVMMHRGIPKRACHRRLPRTPQHARASQWANRPTSLS
jgi:hypothetical protein